jgi:acyl carrier protein
MTQTTQSNTTETVSANLTDAEIKAVQDIVMDQLHVSREQVTPEAGLEADLGADSLDIVDITMKIEERFDITVPDASDERVKTVEDLYEVLAGLLGRPDDPKNRASRP